MPCILPIEIIHNILSYNGIELYKSKNKNYLRFIPGSFTNTIGYLFDNVVFHPSSCLINEVYTDIVLRPNSTIIIVKYLMSVEIRYYINNRIRVEVKVSCNMQNMDDF